MFGDSDPPAGYRRYSHSVAGLIDLEGPSTKPPLIDDGNVGASSAASVPLEVNFSYLPAKLGLPSTEASSGDLMVSFERSRSMGKRIASDPSAGIDEDRHWFLERNFLQLTGGRKREVPEGSAADFDGSGDQEKKAKIATFDLSLAPPSISLSLNPSTPATNAEPFAATTAFASTLLLSASPLPPKKNYSARNRVDDSEDYVASISYSCSVPLSHNPSCSLTRNTTENVDFSRGENCQIWYAGEGTNGSVHSRFRPVGCDGHAVALVNCSIKEPSNSIYQLGSFDKVSNLLSELPAASLAEINGVTSSDNQGNATLKRPDKILRRIVSESTTVVAEKLIEFSNESLESLRKYLQKLIDFPTERKDEFATLLRRLERRTDLTFEALLKAHKMQVGIMVAIKTGISDYASSNCCIPAKELVQILMLRRCKNLNCQILLPVEDCECKICSTQNGFCSACMCAICFKFDSAQNTCSWVSCDVCSHLCHTTCGIENNLIRPGPSLKWPMDQSEMQFRCVGCGHASNMLLFVKDVFDRCCENWDLETLMKELVCLRNLFHASEDLEGKRLYAQAEDVLDMLSKKPISPTDACANMLQFFLKYGVTEFSVTGKSSILAQIKQNPDVLPSSSATKIAALQPGINFKSTHVLDQPIDILKADPKPVKINPHFTQLKEGFPSLEMKVKLKEAEAKIFQKHANEARREAEIYRQIFRANSEKLEQEHATKIEKLCLQEVEERRKKKLQELKFLENSINDYRKMRSRMNVDIATLLERMDTTRKMWI